MNSAAGHCNHREQQQKPNIDFSGSRERLLEMLLQIQDVLVQEVQS